MIFCNYTIFFNIGRHYNCSLSLQQLNNKIPVENFIQNKHAKNNCLERLFSSPFRYAFALCLQKGLF